MRGLHDLRRLGALKGHQAGQERQRAQAHRDAAQAAAAAAAASREAARHAMCLSALAPESDLDRRGLYERLRESAIPRAQASEAVLEATRQDDLAELAFAEAADAQRRSLALERKQKKLDDWTSRAHQLAERRQERRTQSETQEEHACRPSLR
jgi:hypothetical protein